MKPLNPFVSRVPAIPFLAACAVCLQGILPLAGAPVTYEAVTAFEGGAWGPEAGLISGSDGLLYGTTASGGADGDGTVFRTNASGTVLETILHFNGDNGSGPVASLVEWTSPAMTRYYYGTALEGGAHGFGTVFRVSADGLAETLVNFTGTGGTHPGAYPEGALILASDGNFYGTTVSGGANDEGTVFRISPSGSHEVLFEFDSGSMGFNGASPRSALLETPAAGVFLGTTAGGGTNGDGTVFKITDTGVVTSMIHFSAYDSTRPGAGPTAPLIRASDGNYYGTTRFGAYYDPVYKDQGTVFKMTPEGEHTVLAAFVYPIPGEHRGMWPASALVEGQDGYLYGNTIRGGNSDRGVVFRVAKTGGMTTLVDFAFDSAPKGSGAPGALLQVAANEFIGTTVAGGDRNLGTVFRISNPQDSSADFATLINFTGQAPGFTTGPKEPEGGLLKASDGFFYGTTRKGGAPDKGTVFRCDTGGNTTVLVEFTGNGMENKGAFPTSELIEGGDGNFYGTTEYGGANDLGTVFRMTPGGLLTTLVEFSGASGSHPGSWPRCGLTDGDNGYYYGTTYSGGTHDKGTVFRISYAGAGETLVHFSGDETVAKG
ncbi:MAG: hypothetical protein KDN18_11840, partial [Verrucomicrobiae bacterium]|nr:hypothetical protein [Verrucomicrobiae bacterium]